MTDDTHRFTQLFTHYEEQEKKMPPGMTGSHDDADKTRYDLIPQWPLEQLARVYTMGAKKYGDNNYLGGMRWRRLAGSLLRHVEAWRAGETYDGESDLHHLAHAVWNAFTLMMYEELELGEDDRLPPSR